MRPSALWFALGICLACCGTAQAQCLPRRCPRRRQAIHFSDDSHFALLHWFSKQIAGMDVQLSICGNVHRFPARLRPAMIHRISISGS
jgi:hypothetical protein